MAGDEHDKKYNRYGRSALRIALERALDYFERESRKNKRKTSEEDPELRAAKSTAKASWAMAIFTVALAILAYFQWREVESSNDGLDRMNRIYRAQAIQLERQASDTHSLAAQTKELAEHMKEQAEETKIIAAEATAQASAANVSANAAERAAETSAAGIRPWVKITSVELRPTVRDFRTLMLHWPASGIQLFPQFSGKEFPPTLQVKVSMLNIGHSPASDVEVVPEFYFHNFNSGNWHNVIVEEEKRFCISVANRSPSGAAKIGFPSDPLEDYMGLAGVVKEADTVLQDGKRYSSAAILLCVNYKGPAGANYQTQAWYGLYEDNNILIPLGVDADSDHLRVIREESGDHAN